MRTQSVFAFLLVSTIAASTSNIFAPLRNLRRLATTQKDAELSSCKSTFESTIRAQPSCNTTEEVYDFVNNDIFCGNVSVAETCTDPCYDTFIQALDSLIDTEDSCNRVFEFDCEADEECLSIERCVDGGCYLPCSVSEDCACDEVCVDGLCDSESSSKKQEGESEDEGEFEPTAPGGLAVIRLILDGFLCVAGPTDDQFCGALFFESNPDAELFNKDGEEEDDEDEDEDDDGGNSGPGGPGNNNGGPGNNNGGPGNNNGGPGNNNGGGPGNGDGFPSCDQIAEFGCCFGQFFQCANRNPRETARAAARIRANCPDNAQDLLQLLLNPCEPCDSLIIDDSDDDFDPEDRCSFLPFVWPNCPSRAGCRFSETTPAILPPDTTVFCRASSTENEDDCILKTDDGDIPCSTDRNGNVNLDATNDPSNTIFCARDLDAFRKVCIDEVTGCAAQPPSEECCALRSALLNGQCGREFAVNPACPGDNTVKYRDFFIRGGCLGGSNNPVEDQCSNKIDKLRDACTVEVGDLFCPDDTPSAGCCQRASLFLASGCSTSVEVESGCPAPGNAIRDIGQFVTQFCGGAPSPVAQVRGVLRILGLDVGEFDRAAVRNALIAAIAQLVGVENEQVTLRSFRRFIQAPAQKAASQSEIEYSVVVPESSAGQVQATLTGANAPAALASNLQTKLDADPETVGLAVGGAEIDTPQTTTVTDTSTEFEVCFSAFASADCTDSAGSSGIQQAIASLLSNGNTFCQPTNGLSCDGVDQNPTALIQSACDQQAFGSNALFTTVCANRDTLSLSCDTLELDQCCAVQDLLSFTVKCQEKDTNSAASQSVLVAWVLPLLAMVAGRFVH